MTLREGGREREVVVVGLLFTSMLNCKGWGLEEFTLSPGLKAYLNLTTRGQTACALNYDRVIVI